MNVITTVLRFVKKITGWAVVILLAWMVILALLQVILRSIFSTGVPWADQQLRQLVLWIALSGGVLAAAERRHIRIDLVEHYLDERKRRIIGRYVSIVAGIGCLYLAYLSVGFVISEMTAQVMISNLFFGISLPAWISELIIPIGFGLMGLFFLVPVKPVIRKS